jgi:hypothetical protein
MIGLIKRSPYSAKEFDDYKLRNNWTQLMPCVIGEISLNLITEFDQLYFVRNTPGA